MKIIKNVLLDVVREKILFWLGKRSLLKQIESVLGGFHSNEKRGKKIFFYSAGYIEEILVWEIILSKALELRGHRCKSFVCNCFVPYCPKKFIDLNNNTLCKRCLVKSNNLFKAAKVDYFLTSDFVDNNLYQKAIVVLPQENNKLKQFSFEGINIGVLVRPSLFHYLRIGTDQNTHEFYDVYRRFMALALVFYWMQKRLVDQYKPDVIVVINGLFYQGAVMVELAKKRGIRHITYERGYILDRLIFSHTGPSVLFQTDELWERFKDKKLLINEEKLLSDYLEERRFGKRSSIQLWDDPDFDKDAFVKKYNIKKFKKVFSLFTNLLWDSACVERNDLFTCLTEWVDETIKYFMDKEQDSLLIIRVHPSEIKIPGMESRDKIIDHLNNKYPTMSPNIVVLAPSDQTSSYMLMELSDVVLANTSITGLEAACMGKPVIVVGKTHYKRKGFTLDTSSRDKYFSIISNLIHQFRFDSVSVKELARRYAYTLFFRFMIDFPFFKQYIKKSNSILLNFSSYKDLEKGKNKNLDSVCSYIVGEGDLYEHTK